MHNNWKISNLSSQNKHSEKKNAFKTLNDIVTPTKLKFNVLKVEYIQNISYRTEGIRVKNNSFPL